LGAFGSARAVNPLTVTEDLAQVFGNLSKAAARKLVDQIGDTELQKGKISSSSSQNKKAANKEKRESQKKLKDLQQKLQQAVARIPTYLLIDYDKQINSCADLVLEGDQSLFKSVTGYTLKNFEDALQVGCIRKEWIDSSIVDMNLRINKLSLEEFLGIIFSAFLEPSSVTARVKPQGLQVSLFLRCLIAYLRASGATQAKSLLIQVVQLVLFF
jgi:uncharacterized FlaG/YvyC family protein